MAVLHEDRPRQVVPRWRLFDETLRRGELLPLGEAAGPRFTEEMVAGQVHDWKEKPTLSVASDLVSVALTLGLDQVAIDAAQFVYALPAAPPAARSIAALYLRNSGLDVAKDPSPDAHPDAFPISGKILLPGDQILISQAHLIRVQLGAYPRNPILWCNLALLYTSLGVMEKAERAMKAAVWLAPNNRFILRSASRFYLHQGQKDRALRLLADSPIVRNDPWVLAAEIATMDALRKSSRWIKQGRKILEAGRHPPLHLSELASAIGTIELKAGKVKAGRRIINVSLRDPSENSVAQAAWISRNVVSIDVPELKQSPEACAWSTWHEAKWEAALEEAHKWLDDQPFSSRPAIHGSFIASTVFEDYSEARTFAMLGLRSNPNDILLLNNYIFSCCMIGDINEAERRIRSVHEGSLNYSQRATCLATKGLIAFRSGNPELGRSLYKEAIHLSRVNQDESREVLARIYLAMEESRIESPDSALLRKEAIDLASSRLIAPLNNALVGQLKRYEIGLNSKKGKPTL